MASSIHSCINRRAAAAAQAPTKRGAPQTAAASLITHTRRRVLCRAEQQQDQAPASSAPSAAAPAASPPPAGASKANSSSAAPAAPASTPVQVVFNREAAVVDAAPGEPLADVALRAGVSSIQYGCHTGNCGVCEVELRRYAAEVAGKGSGGGGGVSSEPTTVVVRTCVAVVPAGAERVEIDLMDDGVWGLDGWDT